MASLWRYRTRFRFLTLLRASLCVGAIYDLLFALLMVLAPGAVAARLRLPLPGEPFYLWLLAVLLAMVAAVYLLAARDPRRYSGGVAVAIAGRGLGAVVMALAARGRPELASLYALAAVDLGFALAHALFWWPVRS